MIYEIHREWRIPLTAEFVDSEFVAEFDTEEAARMEAIRLNTDALPCMRWRRACYVSYCIRWSNDSDTEFGYIDADELMPEDEDDTFLEYFCGEEEE